MVNRIGVTAGSAVLVVLAVVTGTLLVGGDDPGTVAAPPAPTVTPSPAQAEPTPTPSADPPAECSTAARPFVPTAVTIPGVARRVSVLPMQRDANGVPGVPPLTGSGKSSMAFDLGSGILPGSPRGNALLNAHTYPDGSAMGNRLLDGLHKNDQIVVHGPLGRICYQVTDRVEVPADDPGDRYYAKRGQPHIAIVVCSGKRLGPGEWTKRTLWFATPITGSGTGT